MSLLHYTTTTATMGQGPTELTSKQEERQGSIGSSKRAAPNLQTCKDTKKYKFAPDSLGKALESFVQRLRASAGWEAFCFTDQGGTTYPGKCSRRSTSSCQPVEAYSRPRSYCGDYNRAVGMLQDRRAATPGITQLRRRARGLRPGRDGGLRRKRFLGRASVR